jgi:poly-gamma-glutamate capsule biosynthesis protein CapA/YwtB (metallophosphatase superfamily)
MSSNDPELKDFIVRLHDQVTIYNMKDVVKIMEKAKKKFDALETRRKLESIKRQKDDELIALQTKIKKFEKRAKPAEQGSPRDAKNGKQK